MARTGWQRMLEGKEWCRGEGHYPIAAYSELMPPPRLVRRPYGTDDGTVLPVKDDPWGWPVREHEEELLLRPGLQQVARQVLQKLVRLADGEKAHGIARGKLEGNPYWPIELSSRAGALRHERHVMFMPLALSRTQDDKGRVRWTLFGGSEQGPARAFWKSFQTEPDGPISDEEALAVMRRILRAAYDEPRERTVDLRAAGLRVLPQQGEPLLPCWREEPLPGWTAPLLWREGEPAPRYLLTFTPFGQLPGPLRRAYLDGELHLLPSPVSHLPWGVRHYLELQAQLPMATQIPLLHLVERRESPEGLRVPQSGWLDGGDENRDDDRRGPVQRGYRRTHRFGKVERDEDELAGTGREDRLLRVLFGTTSEDLGLYHKPMARNAQIWTDEFRLVLDGPRASAEEVRRAAEEVKGGGLHGYRFQFPPMRVGRHEIYWHRPLCAFWSRERSEPRLLPDLLTGYLTAYRADAPDLEKPLELWPRLLRRELLVAALTTFDRTRDPRPNQTALNIRKLLEARDLLGRPLPPGLARQLLTRRKEETFDEWLGSLAARATDAEQGQEVARGLRACVATEPEPLPAALTTSRTARRSFEREYWKTISFFAHGEYLTKNNADCVRDPATEAALAHQQRDLEALGDYLLRYYAGAVERAKMVGRAIPCELPFVWRTDFELELYGGWLRNQQGETRERDLLLVIPGRDRSQAVIMADHYDTAFMADRYEKEQGGTGARLAAAGADDNYSATAALMLAAPIFLEMSRRGELGCDVWLTHLTGEEFPADCLGSRHLCQLLVEGRLRARDLAGREVDLSSVKVKGAYVADMIAHNADRDRDVFQIAHGACRESLWLAEQAHLASEVWNSGTELWNRRRSRRGRRRPLSKIPSPLDRVPAIVPFPRLDGEVRPPSDPRSTLYNTDAQIFSDAGVPVVLFMESYDINRRGYHDSHDTMENIDLDYGAAVAAILIESVARAACVED